MPAGLQRYIGLGVMASFLSLGAVAQTSEPLPNYSPLLPQVRAKALKVDPKKGFAVKMLSPSIYMITDGGYECAFAVTGKGVVLFDAPPSVAAHITKAVAEITKEPIVALVYSHVHVDHIGGAGLIKAAVPNLRIISEQGVADFLKEMNDPARPLPTETFQDHEVLSLGTMTADMKVGVGTHLKATC